MKSNKARQIMIFQKKYKSNPLGEKICVDQIFILNNVNCKNIVRNNDVMFISPSISWVKCIFFCLSLFVDRLYLVDQNTWIVNNCEFEVYLVDKWSPINWEKSSYD